MVLAPRRSWVGLVAALAVLAGPPPIRAQAPLPTARAIIDKYIAAMGGEAAFKRVTSLRSTGTFEVATQGISGQVEVLSARPNKSLVRIEVSGIGHFEDGYDGTHGWRIDPQAGPALVTGDELTELADDSWFDGPLHAADHVKDMVTVERTTYDQHTAYKIQVTFTSGKDETEYYDADSGLQLGWEGRRSMDMGPVPAEAFFRDYSACGPIKEPSTLVQRALGIEQKIVVASCETNAVPAAAFDPPAVIKALIK
jgi:zinc protease